MLSRSGMPMVLLDVVTVVGRDLATQRQTHQHATRDQKYGSASQHREAHPHDSRKRHICISL